MDILTTEEYEVRVLEIVKVFTILVECLNIFHVEHLHSELSPRTIRRVMLGVYLCIKLLTQVETSWAKLIYTALKILILSRAQLLETATIMLFFILDFVILNYYP